uniref:Uncharacterized protein n=1 Tax=Arundo donax TaxID=35708 RepID=A0A0A9C667_ARUDO
MHDCRSTYFYCKGLMNHLLHKNHSKIVVWHAKSYLQRPQEKIIIGSVTL